jgi:hypothetical protein
MPSRLNSRATRSLGWAPFASQRCAFAASITTVDGSVRGL